MAAGLSGSALTSGIYPGGGTGIYYQPGSAKAKNCRRGVELLRAYGAARDLPWDERVTSSTGITPG